MRKLACGLLVLAAVLGRAVGAEPRDDLNYTAYLALRVGAEGNCHIRLSTYGKGHLDPQAVAIKQLLSRVLGCSDEALQEEENFAGSYFEGHCPGAFRRDGLHVQGQILLTPLLDALRAAGYRKLDIDLAVPRADFIRCPALQPGPALAMGYTGLHLFSHRPTEHYRLMVAVKSPPEAIAFEFGYEPRKLLLGGACLLLVFLAPLVIVCERYRVLTQRPLPDPAQGAFRFCLLCRLIVFGTWLAWPLVTSLPWVAPLLELLSPDGPEYLQLFPEILFYVIPPAIVWSLCGAFSRAAFRRLRFGNETQTGLTREAVFCVAGIVSFAGLLFAGFCLWRTGGPRMLALCAVAAVASWVVCARLRGERVTVRPLLVGDLRERISALAGKAGVKLNQIAVVPADRWRDANAYALQGNNLWITDYLLKQLNVLEVDAIVAHELGHLKLKHPEWLARIMIFGMIGGFFGITLWLTQFDFLSAYVPPLPVVMLLVMLVLYFVARQFEFSADRQAIRLTGNPEAFISALAKIHRLSLMPMQWGHWHEQLLTHPSTNRRLTAVARRYDITPERMKEIIEHPQSDLVHYALPEAVASDDLLFSAHYRKKVLQRNGLVFLVYYTAAPALVTWVAFHAAGGALAWPVFGVGAVLLAALFIVLRDRFAVWGFGSLRRALAGKLEKQGIPVDAAGGVFVGLAPDDSPRLYDHFSIWDIGFLFLAGERLCYVGEQTRFCLERRQVEEIRFGPGPPRLLRRPYLYVDWYDAVRDLGGAFNLRRFEKSASSARRAERLLHQQLTDWRDGVGGRGAAFPDALKTLPLPEVAKVASVSPVASYTFQKLQPTLVIFLGVGALVSLLFGLSFDLAPPIGSAWYCMLLSAGLIIAGWLPGLIARDR
jgi:Zn-dependent protease with chaperone function